MPSLRHHLDLGSRALADGEHPERARQDAERLLLHVLGKGKAWLMTHGEELLPCDLPESYSELLERRYNGEPIQYILGETEFYGLPFRVTPHVLIPRPETEHVVERALALVDRARPTQILDCGTGSGCIALALARELSHARICASDISPAALQTAQANAERLGLAGPIRFICADLLNVFRDACFDLVVANPPYIALTDAPTLAREVRDHEPATALFAGPDGTAIYRRLIPDAARVLRPGGWVVVELGYNVADAVRELFTGPSWCPPATDRDLAGIERVMYVQRA